LLVLLIFYLISTSAARTIRHDAVERFSCRNLGSRPDAAQTRAMSKAVRLYCSPRFRIDCSWRFSAGVVIGHGCRWIQGIRKRSNPIEKTPFHELYRLCGLSPGESDARQPQAFPFHHLSLPIMQH
jgi:hypothetical protein